MKNLAFLTFVIFIASCGTTTAVQKTGNEGELVITSIQNYGPASSLDEAIRITVEQATDYCSKKGLSYHRNYSIDHGMGIGQVVESTLYFKCVESNAANAPAEKSKGENDNIADGLWKLEELRKSGAITDEEYGQAKSKLLSAQ